MSFLYPPSNNILKALADLQQMLSKSSAELLSLAPEFSTERRVIPAPLLDNLAVEGTVLAWDPYTKDLAELVLTHPDGGEHRIPVLQIIELFIFGLMFDLDGAYECGYADAAAQFTGGRVLHYMNRHNLTQSDVASRMPEFLLAEHGLVSTPVDNTDTLVATLANSLTDSLEISLSDLVTGGLSGAYGLKIRNMGIAAMEAPKNAINEEPERTKEKRGMADSHREAPALPIVLPISDTLH